jgi:hypothetical protein
MIILAIVKPPIEDSSKNFFNKIIPDKKFPLGSEMRVAKSQMMGERAFKIIINVFCSSVLYKILVGDDCTFLDERIGGRTEHPLYFFNHPC